MTITAKYKGMKWPIHVMATTHDWNGRKVSMDRTVEGAGDAVGAMLRAVQSRKDRGAPFIGCEITGVTLLGQVIKRIFEADFDGDKLVKE